MEFLFNDRNHLRVSLLKHAGWKGQGFERNFENGKQRVNGSFNFVSYEGDLSREFFSPPVLENRSITVPGFSRCLFEGKMFAGGTSESQLLDKIA